MELHSELERLIADPAIAASVAQRVETLLAQARETTERQAREVERQATELHAAKTKIQALTLELAHLKRMRYGVKSETLAPELRDLFQETLAADVAAAEAELARRQAEMDAPPGTPRPKRERAGRQPLPAHLPRIEHRHEPESCQCKQCGRDLVKIGEDVTEQLDVEPNLRWLSVQF